MILTDFDRMEKIRPVPILNQDAGPGPENVGPDGLYLSVIKTSFANKIPKTSR